jgi:hypothetical protein
MIDMSVLKNIPPSSKWFPVPAAYAFPSQGAKLEILMSPRKWSASIVKLKPAEFAQPPGIQLLPTGLPTIDPLALNMILSLKLKSNDAEGAMLALVLSLKIWMTSTFQKMRNLRYIKSDEEEYFCLRLTTNGRVINYYLIIKKRV